jgi:hypothetical protein
MAEVEDDLELDYDGDWMDLELDEAKPDMDMDSESLARETTNKNSRLAQVMGYSLDLGLDLAARRQKNYNFFGHRTKICFLHISTFQTMLRLFCLQFFWFKMNQNFLSIIPNRNHVSVELFFGNLT